MGVNTWRCLSGSITAYLLLEVKTKTTPFFTGTGSKLLNIFFRIAVVKYAFTQHINKVHIPLHFSMVKAHKTQQFVFSENGCLCAICLLRRLNPYTTCIYHIHCHLFGITEHETCSYLSKVANVAAKMAKETKELLKYANSWQKTLPPTQLPTMKFHR